MDGRIAIALLLFLASIVHSKVIQAVAHLRNDVINGSIIFTEESDGVRVVGQIAGLAAGNYGFHVHQIGDPTNGCLAAGAHFNPEGKTHGGPDHEVRHVGDLGNVVFGANNIASINMVDRLLALNGENGIVGRTLVLHEGEDDLGLTDHPDSLTTGNAGGRVGCAVIGIVDEVNSANVFSSLSGLVVLSVLACILRQ